MSVCPVHGKNLKEGKFGEYCPTKLQDGSWCRYKPGRGLPQEPMPSPPTAPEYDYHPPIPAARPQPAQDAPRTQTKPEVDWEAKDRLTTAQAAVKNASTLYQGAGLEGEAAMFQCAAMMYKIMMGCKIGGEVDLLIDAIAHVKPREPEAF